MGVLKHALIIPVILVYMLGGYMAFAYSSDDVVIHVGTSECRGQACFIYVDLDSVFTKIGDVYVLETRYVPPVFKGLRSLSVNITGFNVVYVEDWYINDTYSITVHYNKSYRKSWLSPTAPISDRLAGLPGIGVVDHVALYRDGVVDLAIVGDPDDVINEFSVDKVIPAVEDAIKEIRKFNVSVDSNISRIVVEIMPVEYDIAKNDAYTLYRLYKDGKLNEYNIIAIGYSSEIALPVVEVLSKPDIKLEELIKLIDENSQGPVALIIGEEPAPAKPVVLEKRDYDTLIAIIAVAVIASSTIYVTRRYLLNR